MWSTRLDADLVFVPMEPHTLDLQHSHAVISRMAAASRATVLKGDYSSGQILALVGRFKVCTRNEVALPHVRSHAAGPIRGSPLRR